MIDRNERSLAVRPSFGLAAILGAAILLLAGFTSTVRAAAPIYEFSIAPSTTQAGGHPNLRTRIGITNSRQQGSFPNVHDAKNVTLDAPTGVTPNVFATPRCTAADFGQNICPIDSQIGVVSIGIDGSTIDNMFPGGPIAIYNLVPHPDQAGLLGFLIPVLNSPAFTVAEARTESDYGLQFSVRALNHIFNGLSAVDQTIWGVPADHANDKDRFGPPGCTWFSVGGAPPCEAGKVSNSPLLPLISGPSICGVKLETAAMVEAYDLEFSHAAGTYPATTGCDQLTFNPSLFALPTTRRTETASGVDVDLKVPPAESPVAPSPSAIRATTVLFPEGMSINAGAADGKSSCSAEQARVGIRDEAAQCPESSKVGSLTIESSSLPGPMHGYVYLADPEPGDPYRLRLVADEFGIHVKLPVGSVRTDPTTGQLSVEFTDLPQFPFNDFRMHFFGSERGLLVTPKRCGTYPIKSTFTPWDAALFTQTSIQYFTIDEGTDGGACPNARPFNPSIRAGVSDRGAAVHSPFTFDVTRKDGDQSLSGVTVTAPPGLTARLKDAPYCPESAIAQVEDSTYLGMSELVQPACPKGSEVGSVVAGAGAGTHPVYVGGRVYLTGPYKGAPLSLLTVIPALSGPFDLGNVAVRTALQVDPETAQVTAASDPLPQILKGIPLRTRQIHLSLDRPGFTINPTNCDPHSVNSQIYGDEGGEAAISNYFQIANCGTLAYDPRLSLSASGGLRRRGHPAIRAVLDADEGEANSARLVVTLPPGELLDNDHIGTICTRVQFRADSCPERSRIGSVTAYTPLLDKPLTGNVYLRASDHLLPDMAIDLRGQVRITLVGTIDTIKGRLRTTFASLPDTPVSTVVLQLAGGKKGLVVNSTGLCGGRKAARVAMTGQNGTRLTVQSPIKAKCGAGGENARRGSKHRRQRQAEKAVG